MFIPVYRIYFVSSRVSRPWTLETYTERKGKDPLWVANGFYDTNEAARTHLEKIVAATGSDFQYFDRDGKPLN